MNRMYQPSPTVRALSTPLYLRGIPRHRSAVRAMGDVPLMDSSLPDAIDYLPPDTSGMITLQPIVSAPTVDTIQSYIPNQISYASPGYDPNNPTVNLPTSIPTLTPTVDSGGGSSLLSKIGNFLSNLKIGASAGPGMPVSRSSPTVSPTPTGAQTAPVVAASSMSVALSQFGTFLTAATIVPGIPNVVLVGGGVLLLGAWRRR